MTEGGWTPPRGGRHDPSLTPLLCPVPRLAAANHCPGAVIFVFQVGMSVHVHCGDMRFEPSLLSAPFPLGLAGLPRISRLYLDTTYADPEYAFPAQADILAAIDGIVRHEEASAAAGSGNGGGRTAYLCGAYTIGKEKVWMRVWKSLGGRGSDAVHADSQRRRTLECLDLGRVLAALEQPHCSPRLAPVETEPEAAGLLRRTTSTVRVVSPADEKRTGVISRVRVVSMAALSGEARLRQAAAELRASGGFRRLVAFRPTGWSFRRERGPGAAQRLLAAPDASRALVEGVGGTLTSYDGGAIRIFGVPYSEHSSVAELARMVSSLAPAEVIPTVAKSNSHRAQILNLLQGRG